LRILVAEDDKDTTEMYRIVLEARGHTVVTANDGLRCLETYKKTRAYDAIVLDYHLPSLDGFEVAKEILSISADQRIVFVSAYVKETLADAVKNLKRVTELIQKPFEPDLLADLIEDKLSLAKLAELNLTAKEITIGVTQPSDSEIEHLLSKLRSIQKPNTI
jgi:CheY-like chemotaxis protein